jgi:hypothetical protein
MLFIPNLIPNNTKTWVILDRVLGDLGDAIDKAGLIILKLALMMPKQVFKIFSKSF